MNWQKENQDSELRPRKQPPLGHGVHSIARVQPMVPEVSLYVPPLDNRQPLGNYNGQKRYQQMMESNSNGGDSLCKTVPAVQPPLPQMAPSRAQWTNSSEMSRLFSETVEKSVSIATLPPIQSELKIEGKKDDNASLVEKPEDLFKVLTWQNEQLVRLQDQVKQLLAAGLSPVPTSTSSMPNLRKQMVDTCTQMSAPSSPMSNKKAAARELEMSELREKEVELGLDISSPSFVELEVNREGSFIAAGQQDNTQSLPLGASAGRIHFPSENYVVEEKEEDIYCEDVHQLEHIDELIHQFGRAMPQTEPPPPEAELTVATKIDEEQQYPSHVSIEQKTPPVKYTDKQVETLDRFKQMGVSFLTKEDLFPSTSTSADRNSLSDASLWHPRAENPFENQPSYSGMVTTSTSDYSLMINSAALKYLNDAQLTHVAMTSPKNHKSKESVDLTPANVTLYGLPENNLSMATKEFLQQNHLVGGSATKKN